MLKRYEFDDYRGIADKAISSRSTWSDDGSKWFGYLTYAQAMEGMTVGQESLVPKAEALLEKIDAAVETPHCEWLPSIYGAYPIVPEYLANSPECMRHKTQVPTDVAPVSVYVSTTCSGSIEDDVMLARGVAILALIMKLQAIRPIDLYMLAETHGQTDGEFLQVIHIPTQPLNISVAAFVLGRVGWARHLTYSVARMLDKFNGCWPRNYAMGDSAWVSHVRETLNMQPHDLYIGAAREWDDMVTKPVEWVNGWVKKLALGEVEGE